MITCTSMYSLKILFVQYQKYSTGTVHDLHDLPVAKQEGHVMRQASRAPSSIIVNIISTLIKKPQIPKLVIPYQSFYLKPRSMLCIKCDQV